MMALNDSEECPPSNSFQCKTNSCLIGARNQILCPSFHDYNVIYYTKYQFCFLLTFNLSHFDFFRLLEMADSICEKMHLEKSELSASYSNLDVGIVRARPQKFQGATFFMNIEKKNGFMKQTMVCRISLKFTK